MIIKVMQLIEKTNLGLNINSEMKVSQNTLGYIHKTNQFSNDCSIQNNQIIILVTTILVKFHFQKVIFNKILIIFIHCQRFMTLTLI